MSRPAQMLRFILNQVGRLAACWLVCAPIASAQIASAQSTQTPAPAPANPGVNEQAVAVGQLFYEANQLRGAGKYAEAAVVGKRTLAAFRAAIPVTNENTLIVVVWLAEIHELAEEWPEAEDLREEILRWLKQHRGAEHWQTTDARLGLEYLHKLRSLTARERQELHYATRIGLQYELENLTVTLAKAEQVREIRKRILGEKHSLYATSLNNLALLHFLLGNLPLAEPLYLEAREIYRQLVGENHPAYAQTLHNLAGLYETMGDYARAEPLYLRACEIKKRTLGENHQEYARSVIALAAMYFSVGDIGRAESLGVEARDVFRRTTSNLSPDYAQSQYFLGMLSYCRGEYAKAEPMFIESRDIRKHTLGGLDPNYARSIAALGALYYSRGDYARCEALYLEAREIRKVALSERHPEYALNVNLLAFLYATIGEPAKADPLYREALAISRRSLETTAAIQSERQQLAMGQSLRYQLDNYVSLGVNSGRFARNIFGNVLTWKGATLVRQRGMRLAADDPTIAEHFAKLQATTGQLSSLSRAYPETAERQVGWRERIVELSAEKERLEAELSAKSAAFRLATNEVTLDDLLAALPPDTVLVDFLEFTRSTPPREKDKPPTYERQWVAFTVRHAEHPDGQVTMHALGPAEPIASAIDAWRKAFGMDPAGMQAGNRLRTVIWEPLLKSIAGAKTILVSTDGALGRLPLGALPGREPGKYLLEEHRLAMLPVPQLLPTLVNAAGKRKLSQELLLLGDVDYDAASGPGAAPAKKKQPRRPGENRAPADGRLFDPLANTAGEIAAIQTLYAGLFETKVDDPRTLVRQEAGEGRFRALAPRYRHLHLATHGFFAGAEHASIAQAADTRTGRDRAMLGSRETPLVGNNPGILSGLALAGANREPTSDGDDGILTAQEIGVLDLSGVDTVVLSACDTGLGETAGGEGLLGVQRAFQIAGARTTVASFWKVDDLVTRLLMERFYRNLWDKEMPRLDALREAQLYILNHPEALRGSDAPEETNLRASPRYWAAFTLSGDWR
ncbi:MAG: CHAT domain-containing protein [Planctomycetia bacterium]|nr:CHAT domain-containing protein [Planctomycetia bacterium]